MTTQANALKLLARLLIAAVEAEASEVKREVVMQELYHNTAEVEVQS